MNKKTFIILLCILVLVVFACAVDKIIKDDIHSCTQEELVKIDDIGEILSYRIIMYLEDNKDCTIDHLIHIEGIGEQRLKEIKKHYY